MTNSKCESVSQMNPSSMTCLWVMLFRFIAAMEIVIKSPGAVAHTCNPNNWEAEMVTSRSQANLNFTVLGQRRIQSESLPQRGKCDKRKRTNSLFSTICFLVGENLVRARILAYSMEWRAEWAGGACCLLQAPDPLLSSKE